MQYVLAVAQNYLGTHSVIKIERALRFDLGVDQRLNGVEAAI